MGLTLYGKIHGKYSSVSLDMGYGAFFRLRCTICKNFDPMLYEHYKTMNRNLGDSKTEKKIWNEETDRIIKVQNLDKGHRQKVLDFLFKPDAEGFVTYGTCKKIYELVKDESDDDIYGYAGHGGNCSRMGDFKRLLLDVYQNKGKLFWN